MDLKITLEKRNYLEPNRAHSDNDKPKNKSGLAIVTNKPNMQVESPNLKPIHID